ncbi:MAG: patatin-like phospholipase family protein [Immundisolibacter sp.]|uniref:patatin-like phospholipase family protein n=1 Tax=Immundisolibacter sp. TaxID=1934948 RepID=UPI003D12D65F
MTAPRIGIALGSGAARGWAHIGVLRALAAAGIELAVVCGSSIGAVVGAACAAGRLAEIEAFARGLTWRSVLGQLDLRPAGGGLFAGERVSRTLIDLIGHQAMQTLGMRYGAVATELGTGREIWLREGDLAVAIRASMALPGVLAPVEVEGQWLVDGGLVNPVPVSLCRALGAELVLGVNLNGGIAGRRRALPAPLIGRDADGDGNGRRSGRAGKLLASLLPVGSPAPGYFDVMVGAVNIMQDQITRTRLAGDPPDILVQPRLGHIGVLEFNRADEAINAGEAAMRALLPALQGLIGEA